jgi:hypothetical protein
VAPCFPWFLSFGNHNPTARRETSPIHESCTACIAGVAGETSAIIPDTTTVKHPADSLQGLPDANAIVKQISTKTKSRENRAPQLQVCSVGDDKAAAFLHKPCNII